MRRSGTRGYSGYRGRRPDGKRWIVLALVLILLASVVFLIVQRYMVFDKGGSYHFELPWFRRASAPVSDGAAQSGARSDSLEIVIEEPETAAVLPLHALELDSSALQGDMARILSALDPSVNAVALRLKNVQGDLLYPSQLTEAVEAKAVTGSSIALSAILSLTASDYYTIARLSTLHDSRFSFAHMTDSAVLQVNYRNYIWYAPDSTFYLAPEKPLAREYLAKIAAEVAGLGFDELLLDEFGYPAAGRLSNIDTSERTVSMTDALNQLADELRKALPEGVRLSLTMAADDVLSGGNERSGQSLPDLAERFDRIYVPCEANQIPALQGCLAPYKAELVPIVAAPPAGEESVWLTQTAS